MGFSLNIVEEIGRVFLYLINRVLFIDNIFPMVSIFCVLSRRLSAGIPLFAVPVSKKDFT